MASQSDHPCRKVLIDALALLDQHDLHGAACYVAMALDCLDTPGRADVEAGDTLTTRPVPLRRS